MGHILGRIHNEACVLTRTWREDGDLAISIFHRRVVSIGIIGDKHHTRDILWEKAMPAAVRVRFCPPIWIHAMNTLPETIDYTYS